jgi:hypothetical protein
MKIQQRNEVYFVCRPFRCTYSPPLSPTKGFNTANNKRTLDLLCFSQMQWLISSYGIVIYSQDYNFTLKYSLKKESVGSGARIMLHLLYFSLELSNVESKQILSIVTSVASLAWCFSEYNNVR